MNEPNTTTSDTGITSLKAIPDPRNYTMTFGHKMAVSPTYFSYRANYALKISFWRVDVDGRIAI